MISFARQTKSGRQSFLSAWYRIANENIILCFLFLQTSISRFSIAKKLFRNAKKHVYLYCEQMISYVLSLLLCIDYSSRVFYRWRSYVYVASELYQKKSQGCRYICRNTPTMVARNNHRSLVIILLRDEPNHEMNSLVFRETMMTHLLLWGNANAVKESRKSAVSIPFRKVSRDLCSTFRCCDSTGLPRIHIFCRSPPPH